MDNPGVGTTKEESELSALVGRMAGRDERALERFYELTLGRTYAVALRILRDGPAAEEAVEDTYWQAWREASRFDTARGRTLAWLLTICRSRALDALRRRDPAVPTDDVESLQAEFAAEQADPFDLLDALQRKSAVRLALQSLKPQARQLVGFAFYRGMSHREIADAIGMPVGTVKTTLSRAYQRLRSDLSGRDLEPEHDRAR